MNDNGLSRQQKQHQWRFDIGKQILSFAIGVIVASYVIGGARQRVHDLGVWKEQMAPKIERMDTVGTLSFELFHKEYDKTQARQEKRLDALEQEIKQLERTVNNQ